STPCIGITTLEALAASVTKSQAKGRPIVVATDARRKELYFQTFAYQDSDNLPSPLTAAKAIPIDRIHTSFPAGSFVILGSGADLLKETGELKNETCEILDLDSNPDARIIASIAQSRGRPANGSPAPAPVYLRAPDAKLPGGIDPNTNPS
ncbi:MAG: hypothetical protein JKX94_02285, partial [Sneathiella sp.]|nr:hypothetical protein [Sneathiella sp.]